MKIAAILLMVCLTAAAATPPCLVEFAMTSPSDPEGTELSQTTYENLLEKVGQKLSEETLAKMAEAKDPFTVPEQSNGQAKTDLDAVRKHLKSFEILLEQRGWNTPELRAALVSSLSARAGAARQARQGVEAQNRRLWSDFEVVAKFRVPAHAVSPDGQWLATLDLPAENVSAAGMPVTLHLTNLGTRQTKSYQYKTRPTEGMEGRIAFGPDGNTVVLFNDAKRGVVIPLVNHVPDFGKSSEKQEYVMLASSAITPRTSENQRYVYSEIKNPVKRMNLQTHELDRADIPHDVTENGNYNDLRMAGNVGTGQSGYIALENHEQDGKLVAFDFGPPEDAVRAARKPLNPRTLAKWSGSELHRVFWTKDNRPLTQLGLDFFEWPTATEQKLLYRPSGNQRGPEHLHPYRPLAHDGNGRYIATLLHIQDRRWVEIFDVEEKRITASFAVPNKVETMHLTPDGERLVLKIDKHVRIVNFKVRAE